jgi:hypothetical protein
LARSFHHFKDISPAPPVATDTDGDGTPDSSDILPTIAGPANNRGAPLQLQRLSGDFNGDGKTDIAAFYDYGGGRTRLFAFYGNGTGGVSQATAIWDSGAGNWEWPNMRPTVGDFNGDGKTDIAALYGYGGSRTKIWVFYGTATGVPVASPTSVWDSGAGNWEWSRGLTP